MARSIYKKGSTEYKLIEDVREYAIKHRPEAAKYAAWYPGTNSWMEFKNKSGVYSLADVGGIRKRLFGDWTSRARRRAEIAGDFTLLPKL